ncbi:MAG: alanine-tRNA synthetase second additional domain-containing protein [Firmicutes bacterium]|nr:alanine-tRNA synthetase second additional domain-containing protein [Bacillota bacterium]
MHSTTLVQAVYYAPRGRRRLINLGALISQRYLLPEDRLIGLIGDAGAGKSLLVRGMFPELVLTNDDEGVNVRPLPILADARDGFFAGHIYHLDVRFEMAFTQLWELAEAVRQAVTAGCTVVVEHFDLLYDVLGLNAACLIAVGEEVVVTKPTVFGPFPKELAQYAYDSLVYRKMAHSAEDLLSIVFPQMGFDPPTIHSDVRRGFVVEFSEKLDIDLEEVEKRVHEYISKGLPIAYYDENHILIGDELIYCSGPRLHMRRTSDIVNFRLDKELQYSPLRQTFLLVGRVGSE